MDSAAESSLNIEQKGAGSLSLCGPDFICIGKVHRTHGIHGDVVFAPMTDFPERIRHGRVVYAGDEHERLVIDHVRDKPPYLLIGFETIDSEEKAQNLRNTFLFVKRDELPKLPDGKFYFHEIMGLEAVNKDDVHVGVLSEILETGANDVYVIKKDDGSEELVPAIPKFILDISLETKKIKIDFPEWY